MKFLKIFSGQLLAKAKLVGGNIRKGKLVFPCCYTGESTYQTIMIRNSSNFPAAFKIEIDQFLSGVDSRSGSGSAIDPGGT